MGDWYLFFKWAGYLLGFLAFSFGIVAFVLNQKMKPQPSEIATSLLDADRDQFIVDLVNGESLLAHFPKAYSYNLETSHYQKIAQYFQKEEKVTARTKNVLTLLILKHHPKVSESRNLLYLIGKNIEVLDPVKNEDNITDILFALRQGAYNFYKSDTNSRFTLVLRSLFTIDKFSSIQKEIVSQFLLTNNQTSDYKHIRASLFGNEVTMEEESKLGWIKSPVELLAVWDLYPDLDSAILDERSFDSVLSDLQKQEIKSGISPSKLSKSSTGGMSTLEKSYLKSLQDKKFVWNVQIHDLDFNGGLTKISIGKTSRLGAFVYFKLNGYSSRTVVDNQGKRRKLYELRIGENKFRIELGSQIEISGIMNENGDLVKGCFIDFVPTWGYDSNRRIYFNK